MSVPMVILCVAAIAITIWASTKFGINIGILAMFFAFTIGYFGLGLSAKTIYSQWPANITVMYMSISGMFFAARKTGALDLLGRKMIYACRKVPGMIVLAFALVCALLGFLGADVTSMLALFAVLGLKPLHDVGAHPLAAYTAIGLGCGAASVMPWCTNGNLIAATMVSMGFSDEQVQTMVYNVSWRIFISSMITIILFIFVTKSNKVAKDKLILSAPEPFNKKQKQAMALTFIPVVISVGLSLLKTFVKGVPFITKAAGYCQLYVLGFIAMAIAVIMKLVDGKELVEKGIPWRVILLAGGMMCFIGVMTQGGMTQTVAYYMNKSIPVSLMVPIFTLAGAILSCFAGATTTAFALLFGIAVPVAQQSGINIAILCCAIMGGTMATGMAPFSTGGAAMQAYCEVEEWNANNKLFKTGLIAVGINAIIVVILSILGLHTHFINLV